VRRALRYGAVLAIAALGCATSLARKRPETRSTGRTPMTPSDSSTCTRTVGPDEVPLLATVVKDLPDGAVLCLRPGHYIAKFAIDRSLTLRGLGHPSDVVLDGNKAPGVFSVNGDKNRITIANVSITGGVANPYFTSAGVVIAGHSDVLFEDVIFTGNWSEIPGTQALSASAGRIVLNRCRVVGNRGPRAHAIYVTDIASLTIRDSLVADNQAGLPDVHCTGLGRYVVERSTIVAGGEKPALQMSTREGAISISDSILVGKPQAFFTATPDKVTIARSVLSGQGSGFVDGGGNRLVEMRFAAGSAEPFAPAPGSPAVGLAGSPPPGTTDLAGHPRRASGGAAGAFEAP
jgi:hypothetical protein